MKSHFTLLALLGLSLALLSCSKAQEEFDTLGLLPMNGGPQIIYADQEVDSFTVVTSRDCKLKETGDFLWLNPADRIVTVNKNGVYYATKPIFFSANTTGELRDGMLGANNGVYAVGKQYVQTYWLNITYPMPTFADRLNYKGLDFSADIAHNATTTTVCFNIYSGAATLQSQTAGASVVDSTYTAGEHQAVVTTTANSTNAPRTFKLLLKSDKGIENEIKLIQAAKPE